jgi:hypothetical protein
MVRMSHPGTPRRADPLQMRIIGPVQRVALQLPADLCDRYVRDRHAPRPAGPATRRSKRIAYILLSWQRNQTRVRTSHSPNKPRVP